MAEILVTHGAHFVRGPAGHVHAVDGVTDYAFWCRYLTVFDGLVVAARVGAVSEEPSSLPRADGPGVRFHDLPDYLGPWQYLRRRRDLTGRLREAVAQASAHCLRVPCAVGTLAWRELCRIGRPFGVEVMGDPWDSLAPGSVRTIVRPLARRWVARDLRGQCRTAAAAAYVTRDSLQRRYPPAPDRFTTHYSSVELLEDAVVDTPRADFGSARRLISVGSLEVLFKGPDLLIRALARVDRSDLHLTIVGEGRTRGWLEALAASEGVAARVTFAGTLPAGAGVRAALDAADLFVLPSRTEGLPRALIEAMARGLPCIGSTAGGMPELLAPEDLVPPGDVEALAGKIAEFVNHPDRMRAAAERNLARSEDYLNERLATRRVAFYTELRRVCCEEA